MSRLSVFLRLALAALVILLGLAAVTAGFVLLLSLAFQWLRNDAGVTIRPSAQASWLRLLGALGLMVVGAPALVRGNRFFWSVWDRFRGREPN